MAMIAAAGSEALRRMGRPVMAAGMKTMHMN